MEASSHIERIETPLYEVAYGHTRITLNLPEKSNALSDDLLNDRNRALWAVNEDTRVHAAILLTTGTLDFQVKYNNPIGGA